MEPSNINAFDLIVLSPKLINEVPAESVGITVESFVKLMIAGTPVATLYRIILSVYVVPAELKLAVTLTFEYDRPAAASAATQFKSSNFFMLGSPVDVNVITAGSVVNVTVPDIPFRLAVNSILD